MGNIFISYRRDDSIATAGRLRDKLVQVFGRMRVFVDVDDIPHGRVGDYRRCFGHCRSPSISFVDEIGEHAVGASKTLIRRPHSRLRHHNKVTAAGSCWAYQRRHQDDR